MERLPNPATGFAGDRHWYQTDGLDSVVALTDESGEISDALLYEEYGKQLVSMSELQVFAYTGQDYDIETGLYHFYARYYDPSTGFWLQKDEWLLSNVSLTSSLYAYVENGATNYVDIYGFKKGWLNKTWNNALDWVNNKTEEAKKGIHDFGQNAGEQVERGLDTAKRKVEGLNEEVFGTGGIFEYQSPAYNIVKIVEWPKGDFSSKDFERFLESSMGILSADISGIGFKKVLGKEVQGDIAELISKKALGGSDSMLTKFFSPECAGEKVVDDEKDIYRLDEFFLDLADILLPFPLDFGVSELQQIPVYDEDNQVCRVITDDSEKPEVWQDPSISEVIGWYKYIRNSLQDSAEHLDCEDGWYCQPQSPRCDQ
jgi:RHS repeat-associated protein